MEFNEHKPIYLQIADTLCERILCGEWEEEGRIPSVRELGMELGVNPNTIMRTYEYLQNGDIIYNKRGIGYFVISGAKKAIVKSQKAQFVEQDLAQVFKKMDILGITIEEIATFFKQFQSNK